MNTHSLPPVVAADKAPLTLSLSKHETMFARISAQALQAPIPALNASSSGMGAPRALTFTGTLLLGAVVGVTAAWLWFRTDTNPASREPASQNAVAHESRSVVVANENQETRRPPLQTSVVEDLEHEVEHRRSDAERPRVAQQPLVPVDAGRERIAMQAALSALRQHDYAACETLLHDLETRWPDGAFREERLWLVTRLAQATHERERQIAAAEDYLSAYPDGVHATQALAIIPSWRRVAATPTP